MVESSSQVDIGFVSECEAWRLHPRFFPSKVGGKPAWLNRRPPPPSSLLCKDCKEPLVFLCQIYAPIDNNDEAFHRTLYVFICKTNSCYKLNDAHNIKVFRCQLQRDNEFYSYEPPVEDENIEFDDSKCPPLCYVCGCKGPNHCSKCKKIHYCSRAHQVYHWKNGHNKLCDKDDGTFEFTNKILFPERELVIEEEQMVKENLISEEKELEYFNKLLEENKTGCLSDVSETELDQYTSSSKEDNYFLKFKNQISKEPEQVLRYNRGGQPLFIASEPQLSLDDIPNCQYCDGKRQYECQIMPQLLNYLKVDSDVNNGIDWGILAIYTCSNHCSEKNVPYKCEFVFKQDIKPSSNN